MIHFILTEGRIKSLINSETAMSSFCALADRYEDEKNYENIQDYAGAMAEILNAHFGTEEFTNHIIMKKAPFGFELCSLFGYLQDGMKKIKMANWNMSLTLDGECEYSIKLIQ